MFYNKLEELGYGHLVGYKEFKYVVPVGSDLAFKLIKNAIDNNERIMIDPDTDPDGFLSALICKDLLDEIEYSNYTINFTDYKRHGIPDEEVRRAIAGGYKLVIIVDSSSNNLAQLQALSDAGIKVLVIDHHQIDYQLDEYPENVTIINSLHPHQPEELKCVSACFLTALVMQNVLAQYKSKERKDWLVYSFISLYSDSMNLSHIYNTSLLYSRVDLAPFIPEWILGFMNQYDALNRNFIEFKMIPRINALVRMGKFELIYELFYEMNTLTIEAKTNLMEAIEVNYTKTRELANNLAEYADITHEGHYVIALLDKASETLHTSKEITRNFTGVVASRLMNKHNVPVMTLVSTGYNMYQGSVRDPFNRDMLSVFKRVLKAGGHGAAFGVEVEKTNLSLAKMKLLRYAEQFEVVEANSLIIDADQAVQEINLIEAIAEYNELSGGTVPVAYLAKTLTHDMKVYHKEKYISIKWGIFYISVFLDDVSRMDRLLIKPMLSKDKVNMIVNSILE